MSNKDLPINERLINGVKYFRKFTISQWNTQRLIELNTFLNLVEVHLNGEEIHVKQLDETPKYDYEGGVEVFGGGETK